MINGFEHETSALTHDEIKAAARMAGFLRTSGEYVTSICLADAAGVTGSGSSVRVRKMINHLRVTGGCPLIIASRKGYRIAQSREEAERYIASLTQRIKSITAVRDAMVLQCESRWPKSNVLFD